MKRILLVALSAFCLNAFGQITLPIDFESTTVTYSFTNFDGGNATVIGNPQMNGINTSANVGQMIKGPGGQPWGGSFLPMAGPIDFSVNKIFKMKVFSPSAGARVLLKVEDASNGAIFYEIEDTSTVANAWEELTFDFSSINTSNSYSRLVLIWQLGVVGDGSPNFTFLFDDIQLVSGGPVLDQIDLPITFEDTAVNYTTTDFGGNASTVIVDPTDPTNHVCRATKTAAAQLWAGTTISTANGLANAIPFSVNDSVISVRVWSPDSNIPVRLKVEDKTDPTISCETEALTTVSSDWETLYFNFLNEAPGTAVFNLSYNYDMISIFFDFGTDGATNGEKIYYFDDVQMAVMCTNTTSSIVETALDVYTAPSGSQHSTSGIYVDTIPNAAGCDSIITIDLTVNYTNLSEFDVTDINVHPNPTSEKITVTLNERHVGEIITILDQTGRVVNELRSAKIETQIDLSNLEKGLYHLQVGKLSTIKIMKN